MSSGQEGVELSGAMRPVASLVVAVGVMVAVTLSLGVAFAAPPPAAGESARKVVVLSGHGSLDRALRTALAPWGMKLDVIDAPSPGATMPITAIRARSLAAELETDALVWISTSPEGAALWVHDTRTANVTARSVPEPPFDATLAAALALSVKTILRASGLAPVPPAGNGEEPAASEADFEAPPGVAPAAPEERVIVPPARGSDAAVEDELSEPEPIEKSPPREIVPLALPDPKWQLVVHGAARFGAFRPAETGARYGLELRWSPWALEAHTARMVWFGLDAETSTPWVVSRPSFRGEYWDVAPGVCVGVAGRSGRHLHLGINVRGSVHLGSLSGTLLDDSSEVSLSRLSPSLLVRPEMGWVVGNVTFLLRPAVGSFLRQQIYDDQAVEVLETRPFWWMVGGGIALRAE